MGCSKVTDYILDYLEKHDISPKWAADAAGIDVGRLVKGYREPLFADEFLELCAVLGIRPEDIIEALLTGKHENGE